MHYKYPLKYMYLFIYCFSCICSEGFTGQECETKLNHCQSVPCLNGGSCNSNLLTHSCSCTKLYYGSNCQYKRNSKYLLYFQRYDTNDYIKLNGFDGNLTEVRTKTSFMLQKYYVCLNLYYILGIAFRISHTAIYFKISQSL